MLTRIRSKRFVRMIKCRSDENWEDSVPNAVRDLLVKIDAKNRLKVISKSDTNLGVFILR